MTFFFSQQLTGSAVAQPQPALSNNNDIITDTVWTAVNSPYLITEAVTIMPGAVLTIEAGVTVLGAVIDFPLLTVEEEAHLAVQGTAEFPVVFTSEVNNGPADWAGLVIRDGGSAQVDHALFQNSLFNIIIYGENGGPVNIANTVFSQSVYGLDVAVNALHRLQMTDVDFVDVVNSRVRIDIINYYGPLNNNATLTAHPGLEGYEWGPNEVLEVSAGITLTLEPDVTLFAPEYGVLAVEGHLQTVGTAEFPVTFTSAANSGPGDWAGLVIRDGGSAQVDHALFQNSLFNIIIYGENGRPVIIANTVFSQSVYGLNVAANALHRLQMTDVAFVDVVNSRVLIDIVNYEESLSDNATLTAHPGLEGYEWGPHPGLEVLAGITLTLEAGVTLMGPEGGYVELYGGHLQAVGTAELPITFTAASGIPGGWAGIYIDTASSAYLEEVTVEKGEINMAIVGDVDMASASTNLVTLKQSRLAHSTVYPLGATVDALYRLQMDTVTFHDNQVNHIYIETYPHPLSDDVTLTAQPGLEGYEWGLDELLSIPAGITLTLEPGVTLLAPEYGILSVEGHLQAVGTAESPITFTAASGVPGGWGGIYVHPGTVYLEGITIEKGLYNLGIGPAAGPVTLSQSQSAHSLFAPLYVDVVALHHLQMEAVHFHDNAVNRIMLDTSSASPLSDNARLTAQPGLEGYELWHGDLQPYDLIVPSGVTLTAESGVTLFVPEGDTVQAQGHLQASGTLTHPVTFTGILTGTAGWGGLQLQGSAYLSHTQVSQAQASGILVDGGQLTAVCSTFSHNQTAGIWVTDNGMPQVTVTAGNLYSNGVAGLQNEHNSPVEAGHNWWGDASGPGGIGPGSGDAVWGEVVYDPWLTQTAVCPLSGDDEPISGLTAVNSSPTLLHQTTYFTATISAGSNVSYTWDFGDGNQGNGPVVNHTYMAAGVYTATVTAGNSAGSVQAATVVTVSAEAPQPELLIALRVSPPLAQPGETITYTLVLTNSGDVTLHELSSTAGVGSDFVLPHSLAPGVSLSTSYAYTVQAGDLPGPLVNTVSVTAVPPDHDPLTVTTAVSVTLQPGGFLLYLPLLRNNGGAAVGKR